MSTDNLFLFLDMIRAELQGVSDDDWERFKRSISEHAGGSRLYVPARSRKRDHLDQLAKLGAEADAQEISRLLGVSVRQAQRLKRLRG
ncbi:hypothetical protein [Thiobacillus sp. 65-1402]|uniref:hypothetical protein n=1 Tax=Thiobacillus sp. 65-1402 TaxID=1895861 RepID=UPI0009597F39|nr:hypothetical protein [Thiobacillus sp. 65-1402]OJW77988.1 MAG: hypothetical protein BGO62_10475 [Thiobacillus sp. 65-1402]